MAERSSELDEDVTVVKTETHTLGATNNADKNTYLETSSAVDNSLEGGGFSDDFQPETGDSETAVDTVELRSQIEDTRSQMSETIDAIQEKLSYSNISEQVKDSFSNISEQVKDEVSEHISSALQTAKDSVYEATLGKVGNIMNYINKGMNEMAETDVVRSAKKNPLALSLIGIGLGMLAMNGFSKDRKSYRYKANYNYDRGDVGDYDYDNEGNYNQRESSTSGRRSALTAAQSKVTDAAGKVGDTVSSAAGAVSGSVSSAAGAVSGTVSSAAGTVSETASDIAGKAYEQAGNLGSQVKNLAGSAQDQYEYYIEENPLAVGAVVLALGAAVGMSIPSTRFEGNLMGETRDNLVEKAQATARDTIGKVQQVAGSVTDTVKQAAGDLVENVKESAGDVTQSAKDEAKKQGLT